jgi:hypothetical protein
VIFRNSLSQCTTISFCHWKFSPTVPLRLCLPMIYVCRHNDLSSFKIGEVSHFLILSHGLWLNTITKALTRMLQSVKKRKNIQCFQLKFLQCSQHKQILFLIFLVFPLFSPSSVSELTAQS